MSKVFIDLFWKLNEGKMLPNSYSNQHEIIFTPEIKIVGDSAPDWRGNELNINLTNHPIIRRKDQDE